MPPDAGWGDTIFCMRHLRYPVTVTACVGLLAVQLGGLHMHVDSAGNVGGVKGIDLHVPLLHSHGDYTHVHLPGTPHHEHPGDPEHAGDNDISVTEMRGGKLALAILDLTLLPGLLIQGTEVLQVRSVHSEHRLSIRKSRWRPPLRAPPYIS